MKYTKTNNGIHIIEVAPSDFKIILNDSRKKSAFPRNYCNAGFFANFDENNQPFTLPVAHLLCDYDAQSKWTKHYCTERGKFNGNKFTFDTSTWSYNNPLYQNAVSTLLVKNNKAEIKEIISIPTGYNYAISGIPIMKNGIASTDKDVSSQGWSSSPLYGTWHIFVGLKQTSDIIYIIGMKTTTWNMVKTSEAYRKFKELDMYDVIKLDGGGSFHMNVDGKVVASMSEDRRINTIICFDSLEREENNDDNNVNSSNNLDTSNVEVKIDNGTENKNSVVQDNNDVKNNLETNVQMPISKPHIDSVVKINKNRKIKHSRFLLK